MWISKEINVPGLVAYVKPGSLKNIENQYRTRTQNFHKSRLHCIVFSSCITFMKISFIVCKRKCIDINVYTWNNLRQTGSLKSVKSRLKIAKWELWTSSTVQQ